MDIVLWRPACCDAKWIFFPGHYTFVGHLGNQIWFPSLRNFKPGKGLRLKVPAFANNHRRIARILSETQCFAADLSSKYFRNRCTAACSVHQLVGQIARKRKGGSRGAEVIVVSKGSCFHCFHCDLKHSSITVDACLGHASSCFRKPPVLRSVSAILRKWTIPTPAATHKSKLLGTKRQRKGRRTRCTDPFTRRSTHRIQCGPYWGRAIACALDFFVACALGILIACALDQGNPASPKCKLNEKQVLRVPFVCRNLSPFIQASSASPH